MNKTTASLLTGGGLFDLGAMAAGFKHLWGIEIEPDIAAVANRNGINTITGDVATFDYTSLERPYHLHASPVCVNASVASQVGECEQDILIADGIIRALEQLQPVTFTLENVWSYRDFQAFKNILACLHRNGYAIDYWHINAADYGVPQTRKRLILMAQRGIHPRRPAPTHAEAGDPHQLSFVDALPAWVGWYRAIEDLLPELPESQFADWQMERLPDTEMEFLLGQGERSMPKPVTMPSNTITGDSNQTGVRAFLMRGDNASQDSKHLVRRSDRPAHTVVNSHKSGYPRAFVVDCQNNNGDSGLTIRQNNEPVFTITANRNKQTIRAWLDRGRIVSMTPRALARLQSILDDYELPDTNGLACKIVGNAVPPLLARRIMEAL